MKHNPTGIRAIGAIAVVCLLVPTAALAITSPPPGFVDASSFGWNPIDATAALQAAINTGQDVFVPKMASDWIITPISLGWNQTILFESGVTVAAKAGAYRGLNDVMFNIRTNGVSLIGPGATLKMRQDDYTQSPYGVSEYRTAIEARGVTGLTIDGLTIKDTGGDGIYIGDRVGAQNSYCQNVTIKNVTIDNAYRNGISVISAKNLLIDNCTIVNTSGIAPEAGIDFEPNFSTEVLQDITVRNTIVNANSERGITFHTHNLSSGSTDPAVTVTIENVTVMSNGGAGISMDKYFPGVTIKDSLIGNNAERGIQGITVSGQSNTITYSDLWGNAWGNARYVTLGAGTISKTPLFYSTDINSPYYMYLDPNCLSAITHGASDGGYMGARPVYSPIPEPSAVVLLLGTAGCMVAVAKWKRSHARFR